MTKFFGTTFAENDTGRTVVPDAAPSDGAMSYASGFGPDYELDPLDPNAKVVPRQGFNGVFFDITGALADLQLAGFANWSPEADAAFGGYPKNAMVWFEGDVWQSQNDNNTDQPTVGSLTWLPSSQVFGGGGAGINDSASSVVGPTLITKGATNTYTITNFDSFALFSQSTTAGTISRVGDTITLTVSAGETANSLQMTIVRDGVSSIKNVAIGEQSIGVPAILSPASGAVDIPPAPTLIASAFQAYPAGADVHASSDWRIKNAGGTVVWSSMGNTVNKTSITVPGGILAPATQYFAEVQYNGNSLPASGYSPANQFTTAATSISTPSILVPTNGAVNIGETPTFASSVFATVPAGADTHASTNWRLKNNLGTVVWSSLNNTTNKTSIALPAGVLSVSSVYTIEVQYNGAVLVSSPWSVASSFTTAASFSYGKYLAAAGLYAPNFAMYGQDIDTFIKLADPASLPAAESLAVVFSPDGKFVAVGVSVSPWLIVYKRDGDSLTRLTITTGLTGAVYGVSFSPDSSFLAVGSDVAPGLAVYKIAGDVFTLSTTVQALSALGRGVAFSPDGNSLAVTATTTPYIVMYARSGETFTKAAFAADVGNSQGINVVFSPDGNYIEFSYFSSPYSNIYKKTGGVWAKISSYTGGAPVGVKDAAFSPDGVYLAVVTQGSPFLVVYKKSGDFFDRLPNVAVLPTGSGESVAFSADGLYLAVGQGGSVGITIYKRSADTFTKLANPASLPLAAARGIAFYPPVLGV